MLTVRIDPGDRLLEAVGKHIQRVAGVRVVRAGGDLAILRASRVRPTLTLDLPIADDEEARRATSLGASVVAWEGPDDWSHWRRCRAPVTRRPIHGEPDFARRWLLVDERDIDFVPREPTHSCQWHVLTMKKRSLAPHTVQWSMHERIVAPLLGASIVVGREGPLAYDAWRCGRPVLSPIDAELEHWPQLEAPILSARLAYTLPPLLWKKRAFWEHLIEDLRASRGRIVPPMQPHAIRAARNEVLRRNRATRTTVRREFDRLFSEPTELLIDARTWIARKLTSSARRPTDRRT